MEHSIEGIAEGFSGMLYIYEAPIHFGVVILLCIIFLLFALIGIIGALRVEKPSTSGFAGFLTVFFGFLTFMVIAASIFLLPSSATASDLLPYYLGAYSFVGLHAFCLIFYLFNLPWFKKRIWAVFLPIFGTLSWLTVLWFLATPATVGTISDGFATYIIMPFAVLLYSGILAVLYLLLVPLLVLYRVAQTREGAAKMWTWIGMLGLLLWFIAILLMAFVQFTAPFMLYAFILGALAWIIIFLAWLMIEFRS